MRHIIVATTMLVVALVVTFAAASVLQGVAVANGRMDNEPYVVMETAKPPVFIDVPEMMVNLVGLPGERVQYLKVKVVLEVKEEKQAEAIKPTMPRVADIFQTYLRELRASDLNGSAGLFRLKEELTRRVNAAVSPSEVSAVLFKEIVVQ